ncbi:MAG TPA: pilin [Candidatus Paceibacterota bacterium]|nr:pilin [Candidatus Paceibacterota bacterium]
MKKTTQKTFALCLSILFFTFLMPLNLASAVDPTPLNPLIIEANKTSVSAIEEVKITAKLYTLPNKKVIFESTPSADANFSPKECVTPAVSSNNIYSCTVNFKSGDLTQTQIFKIKASYDSGARYSNEISITVTKNDITNFKISASKLTIAPEEKITIKATLNTEANGHEVTFYDGSSYAIVNKDGIFTPEKCTAIKASGSSLASCEVEFSSKVKNNYALSANILKDGKTYTSSSITVLVGEIVSSYCESQGKILDPITKQCKDKPNTDTTYTPLAPLPGLPGGVSFETDKTKNPCAFGQYMAIIFRLVIGISAVLAMVMIVYGGIEYMTSGSVSEKQGGKETITNAILGIVIALGAWLLLNTLNPALLNICLDLPEAKIIISSEDTSTGSETVSSSGSSLCISTTNAPNPDLAKGTKITLNSVMQNEYVPERNKLNISTGSKLMITAQTIFEGFNKNTKSYGTKNPGNISNVDNAVKPWNCGPPPTKGTRCFSTLALGIQAQADLLKRVATTGSTSYKKGGKYECALGNETYNGYLYQYLRIYATGARFNNNYLNAVIGYFKDNGKTITGKTTMEEIYNMK